jgi:hypothetical protein
MRNRSSSRGTQTKGDQVSLPFVPHPAPTRQRWGKHWRVTHAPSPAHLGSRRWCPHDRGSPRCATNGRGAGQHQQTGHQHRRAPRYRGRQTTCDRYHHDPAGLDLSGHDAGKAGYHRQHGRQAPQAWEASSYPWRYNGRPSRFQPYEPGSALRYDEDADAPGQQPRHDKEAVAATPARYYWSPIVRFGGWGSCSIARGEGPSTRLRRAQVPLLSRIFPTLRL